MEENLLNLPHSTGKYAIWSSKTENSRGGDLFHLEGKSAAYD